MNTNRIAAGGVVVMLAGGLLAGMNKERGRPVQTPGDEEEHMNDFQKTEQTGPAAAPGRETAILAGGCFWGMEEILRKIPGVLDTAVGYSGGTTENPTYPDVCSGDTGHAEAIRGPLGPPPFPDLISPPPSARYSLFRVFRSSHAATFRLLCL